ncbi:DUF3710 domain-containing protein [Gordonia humi]|uniref:DUF3710 domain-containing protein n=1 Tax=Gordonia humi TaxID=686429 RepID=A0A840F144_9ACTN|nr:DUF3710 domain-containing protein [Gordonia humi]MBB4136203.1 hypothetical protein [Gordonia humi]
MSEKNRVGEAGGPYDIDDLADAVGDLANSHLDLGSVLMPVVEGGQVTVEMSADHQPEAVYLVTPVGRIGIHAFAAPRSGGLWREVVRELAESLRADGATTSIVDGHWGREVVAEVPGGQHRFIGVDGPRWMVRCVASGPDQAGEQLAQLARAVLAETVVRRGDQPFPPREVLPIVLPPVLAEQVAAAQQQQEEQTAAEPLSSPLTDAPPVADDTVDAVHPGGAVAQSASATVFSEAPDEADTAADVPVEEFEEERTAEAVEAEPSRGSALSRLRRRRSR